MKLYKIKTGVVIETDHGFHLLEGENWDAFVNDDDLFGKLAEIACGSFIIDGITVYGNR